MVKPIPILTQPSSTSNTETVAQKILRSYNVATCTTFSTCDILLFSHCATLNERDFFSRDLFYDSRTIAPEKNCPPTPRLILSQTLALTEGQFSSRAIAWLPPNPKTNPNLDPNPNPNRGVIFFEGWGGGWRQLSGYPFLHSFILTPSVEKFLSVLISPHRKAYSANDAFNVFIENWEQLLDNHKHVGIPKPIV